MARKLTDQQVTDRLWVYDEVVNSLQCIMEWSTESEYQQAQILAIEIQKMSVRFHKRARPLKPKPNP